MHHKQNLLIIILLVVIAGVAGFVLSEQNQDQPTVLGEETRTVKTKTFENTRYGFSLEYPESFSQVTQAENLTWMYSTSTPFDFLAGPKNTDGEKKIGVQIQIRENAENLSLSDWLKLQKGFPGFVTQEKKTEGGVTVFRATTTDLGWKARETYFAKLPKAVLQLSFYANSDVSAASELSVFEAMVASFEVKEVEQVSSQDETYQNGTFGFVIDFPSDAEIMNENYDNGSVAFKSSEGDLVVDVKFGAERTKYLTLEEFAAAQEESSVLPNKTAATVATFKAIVAELSADTNNSYYYIETSRGYFAIRVAKAKDISEESKKAAERMLASFRVYELLDTTTWQAYASTDGVFSFMYPKDSSIKNIVNGVELEVKDVTIGMYEYENFDLPITEWIDNRQLNKYKGADTNHFAFSTKARVDYKEALRVVDPVSEVKLTAYVASEKKMYVIDLKPFDSKKKDDIALFNTILETLKLD